MTWSVWWRLVLAFALFVGIGVWKSFRVVEAKNAAYFSSGK